MSEVSPKQRILIADDQPVNILRVLLENDYELVNATSGPEALKYARTEKSPDLILLDILMPDMDGYEVCRKLKADKRTRDIPVIFTTAMSGEKDEAKGLDLGAVDYVTKPFNSAIVKARVRTHLKLKQYGDHLEELIKDRTTELAKANEQLQQEIVERLHREKALRRSENKYRTLHENLPQKIFHKDTNSVYVSCNENYARDLNIKPEEITGKTDYEFFPKELAEKLDVKPASVTGMLEKLEKQDLIEPRRPRGSIRLSERGKNIAKQLDETHELLSSFFEKVLKIMDETVVDNLSCEIEHHITADVKEALKDFLSKYLEQV